MRGRSIISDFDMKRPAVKLGYVLSVLSLVAVAIFMIYPLLWVVLNGFKTEKEALQFPPALLPSEWHFSYYIEAWTSLNFAKYMGNTLLLFSGFMIIKIIIITLAAYSLAVLQVPLKKGFILYFLATLMVPGMVLMIPNYLTLQSLPILGTNLLGTYWAYWLPGAADGFGLFLLYSFFLGIPKDLFEAARIDGASEFRVYWQIMLPLTKPVIATLIIFGFTYVWKDFFWPLLILKNENWPIATAVYSAIYKTNMGRVGVNVQFGILTLITIPPMALFLFFQRYIIQGITFSGIKG
ncbi:carbohydrate ABC transporter membrane protein 2 (CUT1 family) [Paenibacillus taihuensis]|uniref:Carbohydrate ABC transporter membrane protein 2 (CUT1 family) n=1 Tax=Paenibacillus taihuensis TaxID=1156355 RepID=A0A3D9RPT8_9BACL|nr:carbohydrate ABC transporter permease [Paenibacillus taihuensis]REE77704.1 carbohydrate ABC transporter membrane protein 2 (CUT1 family) [Paenibacillus taihuensis]